VCVCVCVCVCMCVCVCVHVCRCVLTYACVPARAYMFVYVHVFVCVYFSLSHTHTHSLSLSLSLPLPLSLSLCGICGTCRTKLPGTYFEECKKKRKSASRDSQRRYNVTSHMWMRRVTFIDETCHIRMSHVKECEEKKKKKCFAGLAKTVECHATYMNESCHIYRWVMSCMNE